MGDLHKTITDLCAKKGISGYRLCKDTGIQPSILTDLKMGRQKSLSAVNAEKIATYFGVSVGYLLGNEKNPATEDNGTWLEDYARYGIMPIKTKKLPMLGNVACGEPIFSQEEHGDYIDVDGSINADFCLRAKGDSMIGARINDGDIVFIRKQDVVENGEIAAVLIEDDATLKRVQYDRDAGILLLSAENPRYETMIFTGEQLNRIKILGKAVAFQSDVK